MSNLDNLGKLNYILRSDISRCVKGKVHKQCVLPILTYGTKALALTKLKLRNKSSSEKYGKSHDGSIPMIQSTKYIGEKKYSHRYHHKNSKSQMELGGSPS